MKGSYVPNAELQCPEMARIMIGCQQTDITYRPSRAAAYAGPDRTRGEAAALSPSCYLALGPTLRPLISDYREPIASLPLCIALSLVVCILYWNPQKETSFPGCCETPRACLMSLDSLLLSPQISKFLRLMLHKLANRLHPVPSEPRSRFKKHCE